MIAQHFVIIATQTDMSAKRIHAEAAKIGSSDFYYYEDLQLNSLPRPSLMRHTPDSILIARQPYTANRIEQNYVPVLNSIIENYQFKKIFDEKLYKTTFVAYEDKLYHSMVFEELHCPFYKHIDAQEPGKIVFPIIAKKRLSSRAESNFILRDLEQFNRFTYSNDCSQFVFQVFEDLVADFRVLILNGQLLGTVRRNIKIKYGYRATVEVAGAAEVPQKISDKCIEVTNKLGCDLCGFDIGESKSGEFAFIEYNTSPQFEGYERETGVNIAQKVIEELL
jgi:hypothetical protein